MTKAKPGRPPLTPGQSLSHTLQVPVDKATFNALWVLAGARDNQSMAAVVREFIAKGLEESARK